MLCPYTQGFTKKISFSRFNSEGFRTKILTPRLCLPPPMRPEPVFGSNTHPLGQAVGYAHRQWEALNRYRENGILSIDNNLSERTLRMVVIGRKNWLFAGHDNGGHRAAIIYSLVASCKLSKIDPFTYLRDVLDRVSTHPASQIADLLPANWKPSSK